MSLKVSINSLFSQKVYEKVEKVFLPSTIGDATILPEHMSLIAHVDGEVELFISEESESGVETRLEKISVNNAIASVDKDIIEVFS